MLRQRRRKTKKSPISLIVLIVRGRGRPVDDP
jgi:hypothetical protein